MRGMYNKICHEKPEFASMRDMYNKICLEKPEMMAQVSNAYKTESGILQQSHDSGEIYCKQIRFLDLDYKETPLAIELKKVTKVRNNRNSDK